jgi:uncharacterized protein with GYD domain
MHTNRELKYPILKEYTNTDFSAVLVTYKRVSIFKATTAHIGIKADAMWTVYKTK